MGLPIVRTGAELHEYMATWSVWQVTGVCGSNPALHDSVCQTAPGRLGLMTPGEPRGVAAPMYKCAYDHMLCLSDSADAILGTAAAYKFAASGDRLTVLSPIYDQEFPAEQGGCQPGFIGHILVPFHFLQSLGFPKVCTTPATAWMGVPIRNGAYVHVAVYSQILESKKNSAALLYTCTDSPTDSKSESCFQPNVDASVQTADLSSTCIEFVGSLKGRKVKILLDSGASANFVKCSLVEELTLPTNLLSPSVTVHQADGQSAVAHHIVSVDLAIGNLQCGVNCLPVALGHYDVVLGKPWLTEYNPIVNWKLNVVYMEHLSIPHMLVGNQRSDVPKYLISSMQVEELVREGAQLYIIKLTHVNPGPESNLVPPELEEMLQEFSDVLSGLPDELPPIRASDHRIELVPGSTPPVSRIYPLSGAQLAELRAQLQELLERGFIRPSTSPYGSPILFVPKKDGGWRLCVDYRAINRITIKNSHPLPRIDEMFEQLHGSAVYSKLDLASGYHQIRMHEDSVEKTAFKTKYGHYEYVVMPFGLTNAPATFQCVMNSILAPYLDRFVVVYLDDILIYSRNQEEHLEHLRIILQLLREHKFYCKRSKCLFGVSQVEYLGHLLTPQGVQVDPKKVHAMVAWPTPTNVHELRSFMGLLQYYSSFIPHFADVAFPLTELFKKDTPWVWASAHETAFCELKRLVSTPPCLIMPSLELPFVVHVDASGFAIGCVLQQDQGAGLQPIAFESRKLQPAERHLAPYDRELIALTHALLKWKHLLLGAQFTIHTDQQALKYLLTAPTRTSRQERWLTEIMRFMPDIKYVKGTDNVVADALSRRVDLAALHISSVVSPLLMSQVQELVTEDPEAQLLLSQGTLVSQNGLLYTVSDKLFVPSELRTAVISECHSAPFAGHLGTKKTTELLCRTFWWPGVSSSVRDFCRKCDSCQRNKGSAASPFGLLQPLPIPEYPWESVSLDLVTDLPISNGFDAVFVVVDRLTKYIILVPCNKTVNAPQLAQLFIDNVFRRFGMPTSIVSDRDPRFTGHFWKCFMSLLGTQLNMSTAYHPQSDGQTERANRTVEDMLRGFVCPRQDDWCRYLSLVEFAYNNSQQASSLHSPFFLNHGRHPLTPLSSAVPKHSQNPSVADYLDTLQKALANAKSNISSAQQRQKTYADKKRRDHPFKVGDQVMLAARQNQLPPGLSSKLSAKYYGPFPVIAAIGDRAFKLELPESVNIHPVFHVSQLKPYVSSVNCVKQIEPPPVYADKAGGVYEVESIVGKKKFGRQWKFLVKWKGYGDFDNTWEPLRHVRHLTEMIDAAPLIT